MICQLTVWTFKTILWAAVRSCKGHSTQSLIYLIMSRNCKWKFDSSFHGSSKNALICQYLFKHSKPFYELQFGVVKIIQLTAYWAASAKSGSENFGWATDVYDWMNIGNIYQCWVVCVVNGNHVNKNRDQNIPIAILWSKCQSELSIDQELNILKCIILKEHS